MGNSINARKDKGRGIWIWLICRSVNIKVWLLCKRCVNEEELWSRDFVVARRASVMGSIESTGSSPPTFFEEDDSKDLKRQLEQLKGMVDTIDREGGRCLENMDRDLVFFF